MEGGLRMGRTEWLLLLALAVIWGSNFPFYKILVQHLPPMVVAYGRASIGALTLYAVLRLRGERLAIPMRDLPWVGICGILNNFASFSLIAFAETRITPGLAAILNAMAPIFGIITAHLLTHDEKMTRNRVAGVLLGFGGVIVLVGPGVLATIGGGAGGGWQLLAESAVLLGALSYAIGGVAARRLAHHSALRIATGQALGATVIMALPVAIIDHPWTLKPLPLSGWGALLTMGIVATALAYVLYFRIMRAAGATNMLLVTLLVPVSALLLSAAMFGETVAPRAYLGMALIAIGLACIDGRLFRRARAAFARAG